MRKISPAYLLNSFLTKGFFILSQESELVDRFLESMIFKHRSITSPMGEKGKCIQRRKEEMVCYFMLHVCLDCLITVKTNDDMIPQLI